MKITLTETEYSLVMFYLGIASSHLEDKKELIKLAGKLRRRYENKKKRTKKHH